jgi:uncharacterized cupredoxin-like copper-binding protein
MTHTADARIARDFRLAAYASVGIAAVFFLIAALAVVVNRGGAAALVVAEAGAEAVDRTGPEPAATTTPTTAPVALVPPVDDPNAPVVVKVVMGEFSYRPASITVPAGRPVRFEVSNPGVVPHEIVIGDEHAQDEAEEAMRSGAAGSHSHDDIPTIYLDAGKSGVLEATFDKPGTLLIGCHIPGHWAAGMKGTLTVS